MATAVALCALLVGACGSLDADRPERMTAPAAEPERDVPPPPVPDETPRGTRVADTSPHQLPELVPDGAASEGPAAPSSDATPPASLPPEDPQRIGRVADDLRTRMEGTTWHPGCPVGIDELRALTVRYLGFDGIERDGALVVHHEVAEDLLTVFARLYEERFPIERIEPMVAFDGDDDASMAANNTSAFNCRTMTSSDRWSEHAYGWAVDINPVQNPYVRGEVVLPADGADHLDRTDGHPGMLTRPGVVERFDAIGWGWGGDWSSLADHMHISRTGR